MSRSRDWLLPSVTEHRFLGTHRRVGRGQDKGPALQGSRKCFLTRIQCSFYLWSADQCLCLFYLKQVGKANSPEAEEMERVDYGLLLGDHLKAGRGYLPGCRSSAWGHGFRDTLSHTRLASYQGRPLCVASLGYCNTA